MAYIIRANGTQEDLPGPITLETMQKIVGGYVEFLYINPDVGTIMIVDEEGKLKDKPLNATATGLVAASGRYGREPIVGDVLVATVYHPGTSKERFD